MSAADAMVLFNCLSKLTEGKKALGDQTPPRYLETRFAECVTEFETFLSTEYQDIHKLWEDLSSNSSSITSRYFSSIIFSLKSINSSVNKQLSQFTEDRRAGATEHHAPKLSPDVFSVSQQKILESSFQFVVMLGIAPHLLPGVGPPITKRSRHAGDVQSLITSCKPQLVENTKDILEIISLSNMKSIFLSKHLADLLAALIQIVHCSTDQSDRLSYSVDQSSHPSDPSNQSNHASDLADQSHQKQEQEYFKLSLEQLVTRTYQPLMVKQLLSLQAAGGTGKVPSWLQISCGRYLTQILTSNSGVQAVIAGMINVLTSDIRLINIVSHVITTPPRGWQLEKYMKVVAPQILRLLDEKDGAISLQYGRIAATCITQFSTKHVQLTSKYFWESLMSGINCEMRREESLERMTKIICSLSEPQSWLLDKCMEVLPTIFNIYVEEKSKIVVTPIRLSCEQLFETCMKFSVSSNIQIFLHDITTTQHTANIQYEDLRSIAVLHIVKYMTSQDVELYFIFLLKELSSLLTFLGPEPSTTPLGEDNELTVMLSRYRIMSLLASLSEAHINTCIKQPQHIITFVEATISHVLTQSSEGLLVDEESMSLSLGLLTALFSGAPDVQDSLKSPELLNKLKHLSDCLNELSLLTQISDDMKTLCLNLRVAIATHGLVWMSTGGSVTQENVPEAKTSRHSDQKPSAPKPDQVLKTSSANPPTSKLANTPKITELNSDNTEYEEALVELSDPLIPTKGHALINLNKLIKRKDACTLSDIDRLTELLLTHLQHSDSYIYLTAKQALAALCDMRPDETIPIVCKIYTTNSTPEYQMKAGDVITNAISSLGEMAVKYRDIVLPSILACCKNSDDLVRSSALVNLGEVCQRLNYSLSNHINEICECISSLLTTGSEVKVKQAAAHCISTMLTNMSDRIFTIVGAENSLKLYRSIKSCVNMENDELTQHHCAAALETLDKVVKSTLFPNTTLEKRIYVLDAPPTT